MEALKKQMEQIPASQLERIDELFFRQIKMDEDKARKKFGHLIETTRAVAYANFSCQGVCGLFEIEEIREDGVLLEGGERFAGKMLAQVLQKAEKVMVLAVTVHGYEALEKTADGIMDTLFYDAWGTAFVEAAATWCHKQLTDALGRQGLHASYSWSPGQHQVDIRLQKAVFRLLAPEQIGMRLNANMMMYPKKSTTGIIGVGRDEAVKGTRACDFCNLRETCPSAYAVEG